MEEQATTVDTNFVVYGFYRKNWTPYYIGKGRPGRPYQKGGRPCVGPPRERILILYKNMTEKEAFKKEEELIRRYGRKDLDPENGLLHNRTFGGEGVSGLVRTQEYKNNMSVKRSGSGNPMYGRQHKEESKRIISQKVSEKMKGKNHPFFGKNHSEETKKKMSESQSGDKHHGYTPRNWIHEVHGIVLGKSCYDLIKMFPEEKLKKSGLSALALGKQKQHKGWKIYNS